MNRPNIRFWAVRTLALGAFQFLSAFLGSMLEEAVRLELWTVITPHSQSALFSISCFFAVAFGLIAFIVSLIASWSAWFCSRNLRIPLLLNTFTPMLFLGIIIMPIENNAGILRLVLGLLLFVAGTAVITLCSVVQTQTFRKRTAL